MSLLNELKRRNVFRVAIGYVITAWLLLQVVDLVLDNINAPDWVMQVFMLALAIGFPLAVFFAWAFEMTPEGVKRESEVDRSQSIARQTGRKMDRNIIIALTLALAYFAYDKFLASPTDSPPQSSPAPAETLASENQPATTQPTAAVNVPAPASESLNPDEKSVAVLPFVNMSDDAQNEYFSDGISEELLNVLVRVKGLRVPSRTSSFTFKGSDKKLAVIGRELQVDHILEGSVRKSGDRIRVTAQLIEVNTDTHLWSETYTRQLDDIFAVQDEIAQAIVSALKVTLTGDDQASIQSHETTSVEAYNKYLLGRHLWIQRSPEAILAATKPLNEAVSIDANFGQAWAALADAYVLIPEYGAGSVDQYIPLAHKAIARALLINPESAQALTTSAYVKFNYDYDLKGAHADVEKAIQIDPGYATAHQWYAELLAAEGQFDAALDQLRQARIADPLAPIIPHVMGWILMFSDRTDEAYAYFEQALEMNPHFSSTIGSLVTLNMRTGRYDEARARARELATIMEYDPTTDLAIIDALENPELTGNALKLMEQDPVYPDGAQGKAAYLMMLNKPELALDNLEKGFAESQGFMVHMNRMDIYDPLRENPRFQALLKKMNMWP
ncbi:MAG TPA: tetratricopeptide repeat protein [Xanthomonadales bacterium]